MRLILIGAFRGLAHFCSLAFNSSAKGPEGLRHVIDTLLPFRTGHECENGLVAGELSMYSGSRTLSAIAASSFLTTSSGTPLWFALV
jgi:hypothetical protein